MTEPVVTPISSPGLLHHVEIYVSDLSRSRAFWSWFLAELGYQLYQEWPQGFSMLLGSTYLVFVQVEDRFKSPEFHRCRVGLNHLAFHARDRQQVDSMTEALRRRNMTILYADRHPYAGGAGYYAVFFEDPDRLKVELVAPEKPA